MTIAKYLTPSGRDIHQRGIEPDVVAKLSDADAQKLKLEDIATQKDSQFVAAETSLIKLLRSGGLAQRPFLPGNSNVPEALGAGKSSN